MKRLKLIFDYYSQMDKKNLHMYGRKTTHGEFVPSDLVMIQYGLEKLLDTGIIEPSLTMDAGCGDGRIVALFSSYDFSAIGLEGDARIANTAKTSLSELYNQGAFKGLPPIIIGDFLDDNVYESWDLDFSEFKIVFNYVNNDKALAAKIKEESSPGTLFILHKYLKEPEIYPGLSYLGELPVYDIESKAYLHIYEK